MIIGTVMFVGTCVFSMIMFVLFYMIMFVLFYMVDELGARGLRGRRSDFMI